MSTEDRPTTQAVTVVHAEGARIGIATCSICGAAILVDPRDPVDYVREHAAWHGDTGTKP